MSRRPGRLLGILLCTASLVLVSGALRAGPQDPKQLRVCADPDNLPFSNERQEGFENRIAQLLAQEMQATLKYTWWPQRRGFLRNTIQARTCDLLIGVPKEYDPVFTTMPYYRSTYVFVYRQDRDRGIRSLDDTVLRHIKIGVNLIGYDYTNTPPAHALGARGVVGNLVGFGTFYSADQRPESIIDAVARGDVDIAIVWGPLAGYFAPRESVSLAVVPLPDSVDRTGLPMAYDMAMGVRRADRATLGAQLNDIISRRQAEITRILAEYHVPTLALSRAAISAGAAPAGSPPPPPPPPPAPPPPARDATASRAPAGRDTAGSRTPAGRDTVRTARAGRDSLLVSDDEYQGWKWFHVYCYRCHGTDALGSTLAPNLRHSVSPQGTVTRDVFLTTVREGRIAKGMPSWNALLNQRQIEQLYAYVKARSEGRLAPGRPHRASDPSPQ
ncbi:MAG TPA: quinoprotein dehydrogenase-associated putative ABC transporter substrate-binding protein [Gemmatimonadales bacterium]|nr:quinoprotein dehydrogenase-associated putative ABC transporter substrate-binding protein [Gemmatimonadales bacterium]